MKCFARWYEDNQSAIFFRDQTILQFGDTWDLVASLVLLNPGSATPHGKPMTEELCRMGLPYFINPLKDEHYYEFHLDPLMRNILKAFSGVFSGGVVKIYNAFNLKNQNSAEALAEAEAISGHPRLFDDMKDVCFLSAPVIFGPGKTAASSPLLRSQLESYLELTVEHMRYGIQRVGGSQFSAEKVSPDKALFSYHPSYSFTRGNSTSFERLKL